jgi:hypothetical protein
MHVAQIELVLAFQYKRFHLISSSLVKSEIVCSRFDHQSVHVRGGKNRVIHPLQFTVLSALCARNLVWARRPRIGSTRAQPPVAPR